MMEQISVWMPLLASLVAVAVALITWRTSRSLQNTKILSDFESQARLKQIEALLEGNAKELVRINEKRKEATEAITGGLQMIQDFRNYLRRIEAVISEDRLVDLKLIIQQLPDMAHRVESAHTSVFSYFIDTYDLSTLHHFKNVVLELQPRFSRLDESAEIELPDRERVLHDVAQLLAIGADAQSELRDILEQHRTELNLEIERVRLATMA